MSVTMVAKSMQEVAMRYDTYKNEIAQSPTTSTSQSTSLESNLFVEPVRKVVPGDLFEVTAEFDLHSVMAQTCHSMRPVRPKNLIRKYK